MYDLENTISQFLAHLLTIFLRCGARSHLFCRCANKNRWSIKNVLEDGYKFLQKGRIYRTSDIMFEVISQLSSCFDSDFYIYNPAVSPSSAPFSNQCKIENASEYPSPGNTSSPPCKRLKKHTRIRRAQPAHNQINCTTHIAGMHISRRICPSKPPTSCVS